MPAPRDIATVVIHAGRDVPAADPVVLPTVRSVNFRFASAEELRRYFEEGGGRYIYSRYENPTVRAAERALAEAEGAPDAALFASGMAAATTALLAFGAGGEVVSAPQIYGGVYRFLRDEAPRLGVRVRFADPSDLATGSALGPDTRLVYVETPVNPTLRIVDVAAVARAAKAHGARTVVDSTFGTPVLQRPYVLGADLVLHSATKYLNGHSDLLAGALAGDTDAILRVSRMRRMLGGNLDAAAAYDLARGLKTLAVRVRRQSESAMELARRLARDRRVAQVLYPGLADHPDHDLARRQMTGGYGGVVSFVVPGGLSGASGVFDRLRLFARAASLGGVESLVSLPLLSSHHGYSETELSRAGVDPGMIRTSVGLEAVEDLWADLDQALG